MPLLLLLFDGDDGRDVLRQKIQLICSVYLLPLKHWALAGSDRWSMRMDGAEEQSGSYKLPFLAHFKRRGKTEPRANEQVPHRATLTRKVGASGSWRQ